jgi:hypothetical protein
MSNLLTNRGIQATTATAAVLALLTVTAYSPPLLIVWACWAVVAVWAVVEARRS